MRTIAEIVTRGKEEMEEEELARELEERRSSLGLDVQGRKEYGMYVFCTRISALLNIPISLPSLFPSLRIESE